MNQLTVQKPLANAPRDYNPPQMQLIRKTVAKDCNNDEFDMFIEICKRQQLDPFRKQIYAFVFHKDKPEKRQVAFITGIDGYRAIAKRSGMYRPSEDEPEIVFDEDAKDELLNPLGIVKAVVTVYQADHAGHWHPVKGVAYWDEFVPVGDEWKDRQRTGRKVISKENWIKMPKVMIAKCAEAQALRKGWPEECGGLNTWDEMDRAITDMTASEQVEEYEQEQRLVRVGGSQTIPAIFQVTEGMILIPIGQYFDRIIEHVEKMKTAAEIDFFVEMNTVGMKQFWAYNKGDAVELKAQIEDAKKKAFESDNIPDIELVE